MHVRERTVSCSTGRTRRRDEVQGEDGRGHGAAERSERRTDPMDGAIGSVQVGDGTAGRRRAHHDRLPGLYGAVQSGVQNVARGQLGEPADREEDTVHVELERDGMPNGHGDEPHQDRQHVQGEDRRQGSGRAQRFPPVHHHEVGESVLHAGSVRQNVHHRLYGDDERFGRSAVGQGDINGEEGIGIGKDESDQGRDGEQEEDVGIGTELAVQADDDPRFPAGR
ncbi:hypothetical protein MML48_1g07740 [Holotrichia oblita]|uniref:Uncharacterized protein n=1 Tax=Holotrichia oblita TaxID=644536 RepID=A0ACB9TRA7_HOLOL|nr:hypothetical protein MML48_1g07740 [Holotrichia oblita]